MKPSDPPSFELDLGRVRFTWMNVLDLPKPCLRMEVYPAGNLFRWEGDVWAIGFDECFFRVKDSKGLAYIRCLLTTPRRWITAKELIEMESARRGRGNDPSGPELSPAEAGAGHLSEVFSLGDAGLASDKAAMRAIRARRAELLADLDEARRNNDPGPIEKIERELEAITQRVAADYGLSGRPRRLADTSDKARKAVRKCIDSAIRQLESKHAALAKHLRESIRTGYACAYNNPSEDTAWSF